ncbi:MAG: hypothetical protein ACE5FY_06765 [Nitrospiria bacterium]
MKIKKEKKTHGSFRINQNTEREMLAALVSAGYGLKGKSRWIVEAVEQFLEMPEYWDLVDIASEQDELKRPVMCVVPESLHKKIEDAIDEVRTHFPRLEGVKSNIFRAAIIQRLLRT